MLSLSFFKPTPSRPLAVWIVLGLLMLGAGSVDAETPSPPERIVSLLPSLTEMVYAVGAGDQVVGLTKHCTYPPETANATVVGGYVPASMSFEQIIALRPDLVLAAGDFQGQAVEQLRGLGLRVESVAARDVEGVLDGLRRVGELTGHAENGERVASDLEQELDQFRRRYGELPWEARPRVFYEVWHEPLMTAGGRSFISQLIELAGGHSLFHDTDREYFQVSFEDVVARRPELILGAEIDGGMGNLQLLAEQPGWRDLPAVRDGRVFGIDGDVISRPGPRLGEALKLIEAHLHGAAKEPGTAKEPEDESQAPTP